MTSPPTDPRPPLAANADIRPIVARQSRQVSIWLMAGGLALGGVLLFLVLDGQRRAASAPSIQARSVDSIQTVQAPPPLYVLPDPPVPLPPAEPPAGSADVTPPSLPAPPMPPAPLQPIPFAPQPPPPEYAPPQGFDPPQAMPAMAQDGSASTSAALVIDTTAGTARNPPATEGADQASSGQDVAVRSGRLRRTATTVPQGALIPAVLETALDSTRAGNVRAIVSRDIRGFDGSRVLIPRGSRLFGEYQTELAAGQNRALVEWTRLVRPDGVTIALASPAGDLQGRTGVRGRVDNHFLERFGSALLQTTLNIGTAAAGRSLGGDGGVIVALPGSTQNTGAAPNTNRLQPTLRTEAGARVTVLVSRDLEFASGEARP